MTNSEERESEGASLLQRLGSPETLGRMGQDDQYFVSECLTGRAMTIGRLETLRDIAARYPAQENTSG